jgi:hypothetical protein
MKPEDAMKNISTSVATQPAMPQISRLVTKKIKLIKQR